MSHNFHNKDASMGGGCRVDAVNSVCGDIHRALESEGHVSSPEVIIDRLRETDHVESLLA